MKVSLSSKGTGRESTEAREICFAGWNSQRPLMGESEHCEIRCGGEFSFAHLK
jgi:hypothetical protein